MGNKSLKKHLNKITFADIELSTNLTEKNSKQIAEFINENFDIVDFNVNYNEDFDAITISLAETYVYNISIIIYNDIKGKTLIKLVIEDQFVENPLPKNIRVCNLKLELEDLYNYMLSQSILY